MYKPRKPNSKAYLAICDDCGATRIEGRHKRPFYCRNCNARVSSQLMPFETALGLRQRHIDGLKDNK